MTILKRIEKLEKRLEMKSSDLVTWEEFVVLYNRKFNRKKEKEADSAALPREDERLDAAGSQSHDEQSR